MAILMFITSAPKSSTVVAGYYFSLHLSQQANNTSNKICRMLMQRFETILMGRNGQLSHSLISILCMYMSRFAGCHASKLLPEKIFRCTGKRLFKISSGWYSPKVLSHAQAIPCHFCCLLENLLMRKNVKKEEDT